jgi:hypothetical protein
MGPCGPFEIRICLTNEPLVIKPALCPKEVAILNSNKNNIKNHADILLFFII